MATARFCATWRSGYGASMVTISVAITTYCGIRHLAQQLDSIAGQLRAPDQVIICDDASDDGTWAIVKAWSHVVPFRVVTHCQQSNVGLRRNVETALRLCDRDVIVLADQDDIWSPEKLAVVETAFTDPDVTLWFSDADLIDDAGRLIGRRA